MSTTIWMETGQTAAAPRQGWMDRLDAEIAALPPLTTDRLPSLADGTMQRALARGRLARAKAVRQFVGWLFGR